MCWKMQGLKRGEVIYESKQGIVGKCSPSLCKIIEKYFWIAAPAKLFPALLKERWKLVNFRDQAFAQLNYKISKADL